MAPDEQYPAREVDEAREVDDDDAGPAVDLTVTLRLGLEHMRKQKTMLCSILSGFGRRGKNDAAAEGLINLLDFLQDAIVDQGLATEKDVFGPDYGDDDDTRHRD